MDSYKAPGPQDRSNGSLSPITADTLSGRNRAASVKSNRSGTTIVEDGSHSGEEDHKLTGQFSRTGTLDIDIKPVSRLEFLLGLFGPEKMTRKIAQKAKINGVDNYEYESSRGSPYIVSIHALSTRKDEKDYHVPKLARCTLDTGNHQGNLVSKKFLMKDLEYSDSELLPLNSSEKNGGLSASNHQLMPEAAVVLTWYHPGGTRLFRNMRFLVMSNTQYDFVIGARSIAKHYLLSPPNFGVVQYKADTDEEATNLEADKAKLKDELLTLEHQLTKMQKKTPDKTDDVAAKEAEITNKKKQIAEATEVLKQYRDSKTAGNQIPGKDKTQTNGTNGTTKNKKTNGQNNKTKGADNESKGENSGHTKPKPGGIFRKRNNNGG